MKGRDVSRMNYLISFVFLKSTKTASESLG